MDPAAVELEAYAGLEVTVNDPFLVRRGLRAGVAARPVPWGGATLSAAAYPDLGALDYTATTRVMIAENEVAPDLSRIVGQYTLLGELTPIRTDSAPIAGALRFGVGAALVDTVDDLEVLPSAMDTDPRDERQLHLGFAWSMAADALRGPVGLRLRCAQTWYVEQVIGSNEQKRPLWLGADVIFVPLGDRTAGT